MVKLGLPREALPLPLLEVEKSEGDKVKAGVEDGYGNGILSFPSASYFLGLPLFFFPKLSPPAPATGTIAVAPSRLMFITRLLTAAGGESVSELPSDPDIVLSFSSIFF